MGLAGGGTVVLLDCIQVPALQNSVETKEKDGGGVLWVWERTGVYMVFRGWMVENGSLANIH